MFTPSSDHLLVSAEKEVMGHTERRLNTLKWFAETIGRKATSACAILASVTLPVSIEYLRDVDENRTRAAETKVTIETILDTEGNTLTYSFGGYNSINGDSLALSLNPAIQEITPSSLASIRLGEGAPDTTEVRTQFSAQQDSVRPEEYSTVAHSLGSLEATRTIAELAREGKQMPTYMIQVNPPSGFESFQPDKQQLINDVLPLIAKIPYSEDSDYIKFGLIFASLEGKSFEDRWNLAWQIVENHESPRMGTLQYQINLAQVDLKQEYAAIAKASEYGPTPVKINIKGPKDDTIKDGAAENDCKIARKFNISCIVIEADVAHNDFWKKTASETYTQAITDNLTAIHSAIEIQQNIYAIRQQDKIIAAQNAVEAAYSTLDPTLRQ